MLGRNRRWIALAGVASVSGCTLILGANKSYHEVEGTGGAGGTSSLPATSSTSTSGGGGPPAISSASGGPGGSGGSSSTTGSGGSSSATSSTSSSSGGSNNPALCPGEAVSLSKGTPVTISGNTTGATDKFTGGGAVGTCMQGTFPGPDLVYAVQPQTSGTLTATLNANYNDSLLHIRSACPGTAADELACNYLLAPKPPPLDVTLAVTSGQTYYVVADSFDNTSGPFTFVLALN